MDTENDLAPETDPSSPETPKNSIGRESVSTLRTTVYAVIVSAILIPCLTKFHTLLSERSSKGIESPALATGMEDTRTLVHMILRNSREYDVDLADLDLEELSERLGTADAAQLQRLLTEMNFMTQLKKSIDTGNLHENDVQLYLTLLQRVSALDPDTRAVYDHGSKVIIALANNDNFHFGAIAQEEMAANERAARECAKKIQTLEQLEHLRVCNVLLTDLILRTMARQAQEDFNVPSPYDEFPEAPSEINALTLQGWLNEELLKACFMPMEYRVRLVCFAENTGQLVSIRIGYDPSPLDDKEQGMLNDEARKEGVKAKNLREHRKTVQALATYTFEEQALFVEGMAESEFDDYSCEGDLEKGKACIRAVAKKQRWRAENHRVRVEDPLETARRRIGRWMSTSWEKIWGEGKEKD